MTNQRKKGKVDWYNRSNGYGVIKGEDNQDYFIHHTNLPADIQFLNEGEKFSFDFRKRHGNKKGFEAFDIKIIPQEKEISKRPEPKIKTIPRTTPEAPPKTQPKTQSTTRPTTRSTTVDPSSRPAPDYYSDWGSVVEREIMFVDRHRGYRNYYNANPPNQYQAKDKTLYSVKVVGVTYEGRQEIVAQLELGEELLLVREPSNPYDFNAIRVVRKNGQQVGYLSKELAAQIACRLDELGTPIIAEVIELLGGYSEYSSLGVQIKFRIP